MSRAAVWLLAALAADDCKRDKEEEDELADIGLVDATTEPAPGVHAPIGRGDLAAISAAGRWMHQARRALELADAAVVERMGNIADDVVVPLVDIDPGGGSGQVVFVRWPNRALSTEPLRVEDAERWVLVAVTLAPERVLDVELLSGLLEPGSTETRRVEALLVAGAALQRAAPKQAFFTADRFVEEIVVTKKGTKVVDVVTLVYALADGADGPDLEIAIGTPQRRRKQPLELLRSITIHPLHALNQENATIAWPDPHPLTVARALERGAEAGPLVVRVQSGSYRIAPTDGRVERIGP